MPQRDREGQDHLPHFIAVTVLFTTCCWAYFPSIVLIYIDVVIVGNLLSKVSQWKNSQGERPTPIIIVISCVIIGSNVMLLFPFIIISDV